MNVLTVTTLNGATTAPITDYKDDEMYEEVLGDFTLSFASFLTPENVGHALLTEESIVEYSGHKFRVKQVTTTHHTKRVNAVHTYFDNADKRKYDIYGGTHTLNEFMTYVLAGTGWTYENVDVNGSAFIPNFGNDNVVTLIDALCGAFNCEFKINGNNTLTFSKSIGPNKDAVYRFKYNIRALQHDVDTTKLKTVIQGTGANGLTVTYRSPNVSVFGERHAEPFEDDEYFDTTELGKRLAREIIDYPEVTIEVDTIELTEKELGERVWLIYEPLGIEFQTRILAKTTRTPRSLSTVVIGNTLGKSGTKDFAEVNIDIDENKKEYRSKIEQTNDRITLEVEEVGASIAAVSVKADNISLTVNNRITNEMAAINVKADNITLSVSNLNSRMQGAESSISVQAGQIQSKVSQTDYNGNTITSMINQNAYGVQIDASKINLNGYVTISSLNSPGSVTISEGNIVGNSFTVGRGTGSPTLSMYASYGSHRLYSADAAGFRIESNGTLSLQAGPGWTVYSNSKFWAANGLEVSGSGQFNNSLSVAGELNASTMFKGGRNVATTDEVSGSISIAIRNLENDIKAWANGKFVTK